MNNSGITAQFGFEYQKEVFINLLIKNMKKDFKLTYEKDDDVSIEGNEEDNLTQTIIDSKILVQCKSGTVSHDTIVHVFSNWLLVLDAQNEHVLYTENPISINYSKESIEQELTKKIKNYYLQKRKRSDSILYRLMIKYYDSNSNQVKDTLKKDIEQIFNTFKAKNDEITKLFKDSKQNFIENYSAALKTEAAKNLRYEYFNDKINTLLGKSIREKRCLEMNFEEFCIILENVITKVTDKVYKPDYSEVKDNTESNIEKIKKQLMRESDFLMKLSISHESFVELLINEIYYKAMREGNISINKYSLVELAESIAHANYLFTNDMIKDDIKKLFYTTIDKDIESDLIYNTHLRRGCYLFLSGDESEEKYFINWGGENEK